MLSRWFASIAITTLQLWGIWTIAPKPDIVKKLFNGFGEDTRPISELIRQRFSKRWDSVSALFIPSIDEKDTSWLKASNPRDIRLESESEEEDRPDTPDSGNWVCASNGP